MPKAAVHLGHLEWINTSDFPQQKGHREVCFQKARSCAGLLIHQLPRFQPWWVQRLRGVTTVMHWSWHWEQYLVSHVSTVVRSSLVRCWSSSESLENADNAAWNVFWIYRCFSSVWWFGGFQCGVVHVPNPPRSECFWCRTRSLRLGCMTWIARRAYAVGCRLQAAFGPQTIQNQWFRTVYV